MEITYGNQNSVHTIKYFCNFLANRYFIHPFLIAGRQHVSTVYVCNE